MVELNIQRIDTQSENVEHALAELRQRLSPQGNIVSESGRQLTLAIFGEPLSPQQVVARICSDVQTKGAAAVFDYGRSLDKAELDSNTIRASAEELAAAHGRAEKAFLATIDRIRDNICEFQQSLLSEDVEVVRPEGVRLRHRYRPMERVGICVPGGAAAYPSTVLMTALPAQVAGVKEIVVIAPPTPFGSYNDDLLATCHAIGVNEVYRIGGAQGVAALAYGIEGIPKVDKIVGPGNMFVALAKRYVYGEVDIDSIAGPSEVVVLADETTRPDYAAADLLAQAEHSPGASILIAWNKEVIDAIYGALCEQVAAIERSEMALQSLEDFGALILARDAEEACQISNSIAPEHLHVGIDSAEPLLDKLHHAGAIFLGNYSPVAIGDYAAGPSHVLPTGGTARWANGLSANDFLTSSSVIEYSREGLSKIAPDACRLAEKEGLTAHRASISIRCDD